MMRQIYWMSDIRSMVFEVIIAMPPEEQEHAGFVPVMVARSAEEAKQYCELLSDHDIPALAGNDKIDSSPDDCHTTPCRGITHGVAVLVPEELLEEAGEVIAQREDADEFLVDSDEVEDGNDNDFSLEEDLSAGLVEQTEEDPLFDGDDKENFEDEEENENP